MYFLLDGFGLVVIIVYYYILKGIDISKKGVIFDVVINLIDF